jgi:hypothetical protein
MTRTFTVIAAVIVTLFTWGSPSHAELRVYCTPGFPCPAVVEPPIEVAQAEYAKTEYKLQERKMQMILVGFAFSVIFVIVIGLISARVAIGRGIYKMFVGSITLCLRGRRACQKFVARAVREAEDRL